MAEPRRSKGQLRVAGLIAGAAVLLVVVPLLTGFRWWTDLVVLAATAVLLRVFVTCPRCRRSRASNWLVLLEGPCPHCGHE